MPDAGLDPNCTRASALSFLLAGRPGLQKKTAGLPPPFCRFAAPKNLPAHDGREHEPLHVDVVANRADGVGIPVEVALMLLLVLIFKAKYDAGSDTVGP